jgi:hypothetical protein
MPRVAGREISMSMKRFLVPLNLGMGATRHIIWYLSYQITGEARAQD